jgi:hypothetical protein
LSRRIAIEIDVLSTPAARAGRDAAGDFWEGLGEREPGILSRLAHVAAARRWEIIFLTKQRHSSRGTPQVDAQRWLESKGFALPSVYITGGSRGRIASALRLDIVIHCDLDDCAGVAARSGARAFLVPDEPGDWPEDRRAEFEIVHSVGECLDLLTAREDPTSRKRGFLAWVQRLYASVVSVSTPPTSKS